MNDNISYERLKFIKKMYDNSFYPATYNIEKNCFEYPSMPKYFYWPNPGYCKLPKEFMNEITKSIIKEFSDKYGPF
jgi:hypothetical protein